MKAKRVKTKNNKLFAVRLPSDLVDKVNKARARQGLEWAPLVVSFFERYLREREKVIEMARLDAKTIALLEGKKLK